MTNYTFLYFSILLHDKIENLLELQPVGIVIGLIW